VKANQIKSNHRVDTFCVSCFLRRFFFYRIPAVARKCQRPSGKHSKDLFTSFLGQLMAAISRWLVHYHACDNVLIANDDGDDYVD